MKLTTILPLVTVTGLAFTANAATVTISTTAPSVDATDESNIVATTSTLKWFHDIEHDAGQTFTPSATLTLDSFTIQLGAANEDDGPDWLNVRIGTITRPGGVFTFTDLAGYAPEVANLGADQVAGDYLTFTLDVPQIVTGGVEYGVILDAQNFGDWHVGIPYLAIGSNGYTGGNAIGRGSERGDDLVFHANLVPEPSSALLGIAGVLGLFARRRRV